MKLYRHKAMIDTVYYTTCLTFAESDYLIRPDPTVKQRRYTVSRRCLVTNGVAPQWDWEVVHDARTITDARDFITVDRINPQ